MNKKIIRIFMKRPVRYALIVLLFASFVSPALVMAHTADLPSDVTSSPNSQLYQDGSSTETNVRQQQVREYRQRSSDLQQKISALGTTPTASVLMPVLFGVGVKDISSNFGVLRPSGRIHEGEDIMAVKGTPIVSPTAAVVIRIDYGPGEGNAVYTANPGGETFVYYHLDRIGEGVVSGLVLSQGSLIGYVGNTGSASTTAAHLHFEIHDSSGTPLNPFLRLTSEFSIGEKIAYLTTILSQTTDSVALSRFLVTNFRGTFIAALAANIALPLSIIDAIAFIPATASGGGGLPPGDLDIGSSGSAVAILQKYLIQAASGAGAMRLAGAGATGYFGIITKAALVEYQVVVGISPPSGYYGATTRAFIEAHPLATSQPPPTTTGLLPVGCASTSGFSPVTGVSCLTGIPPSSNATLTRDLYQGISGEDVRTLQKLLNAGGYIVALTGSGSLGNEIPYFGPGTKAAVIKFQIARSISPAAGYVGPLTRTALASF